MDLWLEGGMLDPKRHHTSKGRGTVMDFNSLKKKMRAVVDETMVLERPNQNYHKTIPCCIGANMNSYPGFPYLWSCHTLAGHLEGAGRFPTGRFGGGGEPRAPLGRAEGTPATPLCSGLLKSIQAGRVVPMFKSSTQPFLLDSCWAEPSWATCEETQN